MNRTPIEQARNLGPITAEELAQVGISTREQLVEIGWEEAFARLIRVYPHRLNLNMCYALIGAIDDRDWRRISTSDKAAAQALIKQLRRGL